MILTFEDGEDKLIEQIAALARMKTLALCDLNEKKSKLLFQGLEIDMTKRLIKKKNKEVVLTATEFDILLLLAQNEGMVFSKEQIYDMIWKEPYVGDYSNVISHIHNIREKIEDIPSCPVYIQTVWGVGYRFNKNVSNGLEH